MGIKYTYTCDFCGGRADDHKTFVDKRIICKNCLNHLEKQTWRLAEEPRELQKEKNKLEEEKNKLEEEKKEFCKFVEEKSRIIAADKLMAERYRKVVYTLIGLYNRIIYELDKIVPRGFLNRRPSFKLVDIENFKELEGITIDNVVREVEGNYYNNFNYYGCSHIDIERIENFPMTSLPWDN